MDGASDRYRVDDLYHTSGDCLVSPDSGEEAAIGVRVEWQTCSLLSCPLKSSVSNSAALMNSGEEGVASFGESSAKTLRSTSKPRRFWLVC